jgi:cystathionine beta-lyase/cystathionine gamma-synthase
MPKTCVPHLQKDKKYCHFYPNTNEFVEKVCKMEGQLLVLPSGMAAVYSTMAALLNSGDHLRVVFWNDTHSLFINYFKMEYSNIVF